MHIYIFYVILYKTYMHGYMQHCILSNGKALIDPDALSVTVHKMTSDWPICATVNFCKSKSKVCCWVQSIAVNKM